jgi:hypothetical protein
MSNNFKYDSHSFAEAMRVHKSHARQTFCDGPAARAWLAKYVDANGKQISELGGGARSTPPAQSVGSSVGDKVAPQAETPAPEPFDEPY